MRSTLAARSRVAGGPLVAAISSRELPVSPAALRSLVVIAVAAQSLSALASLGCAPISPASHVLESHHASGQSGAASSNGASDGKSRRRVIVLSIDGLMPQAYTEAEARGLDVPTLRMLRDKGAFSPGATSVFPSVTYPAHTTIATGVNPGAHRITTNLAWDPLGKNHEGWFWYAEDIAVPTLWQIAEKAGATTALITWPVTVGARVDYCIPEYWRAGTADDTKLMKALSTPGLIDRISSRFPSYLEKLTPPDIPDSVAIDAAVYLLETDPPDLMFVHVWDADTAQHDHGPWSPQARARIEVADRQTARLLEAIDRNGVADETVLIVLSDHGFTSYSRRVRPGVILAGMNLVTPSKKNQGQLEDWRAAVVTSGGTAYIYVKDDSDQQTRDALVARFTELAKAPESGVAAVYDREQIRARGGDPRAFLALAASDGYAFSNGYHGDLVQRLGGDASSGADVLGHHGYDPALPEMNASLLIYGPAVKPGEITGARLLDVAPTAARWLGLTLDGAEGTALDVFSR